METIFMQIIQSGFAINRIHHVYYTGCSFKKKKKNIKFHILKCKYTKAPRWTRWTFKGMDPFSFARVPLHARIRCDRQRAASSGLRYQNLDKKRDNRRTSSRQ